MLSQSTATREAHSSLRSHAHRAASSRARFVACALQSKDTYQKCTLSRQRPSRPRHSSTRKRCADQHITDQHQCCNNLRASPRQSEHQISALAPSRSAVDWPTCDTSSATAAALGRAAASRARQGSSRPRSLECRHAGGCAPSGPSHGYACCPAAQRADVVDGAHCLLPHNRFKCDHAERPHVVRGRHLELAPFVQRGDDVGRRVRRRAARPLLRACA